MGPFLAGIADSVIHRHGQPQGEPGQGVGRGGERSQGQQARLSGLDPADLSANR